MVPRPKGLIQVDILIKFNSSTFNGFEINLEHINKDNRANLTIEEALKIITTLIFNQSFKEIDRKKYGKENCYYYTHTGAFKTKNFRIVFCICSDRSNKIGIITLYRVKGNKK